MQNRALDLSVPTPCPVGEDESQASLKREVMVTVAPGILEHKPRPYTKAFDPLFTHRTLSLRCAADPCHVVASWSCISWQQGRWSRVPLVH